MLRPSPNHGTQRLPNDDYDMTKIRVGFINIWERIKVNQFTKGPKIIIIYFL